MKLIVLTDRNNYHKEYVNVDFITNIMPVLDDKGHVKTGGSVVYTTGCNGTYVRESIDEVIRLIRLHCPETSIAELKSAVMETALNGAMAFEHHK